MASRHPHVVNVEDVEIARQSHGERYGIARRQLGRATGGAALGCSHVRLEPGLRSWPLHWHAANEEAIFVLSGEGTVQIGDDEVPIRAGDYIAFPTGPQAAHRTHNTGTTPLEYLCISTMVAPDFSVYPETGKIGVFGGAAPGGNKDARYFETFLELSAKVGYWDREPER